MRRKDGWEGFNMKLYVIVKGWYSDAHIVAIVDDKKNAEKLAKYFSHRDDTYIQMWDLNTVNNYRENESYWDVIFDNAGKDVVIKRDIDVYRKYDDEIGCGGFGASVWAPDKDHALKKAYDMRAEYLAFKNNLT